MQILIVAAGVAALLVLILRFKLPAFVALLIVSTAVGLALGMDAAAVLTSIKDGMASTLGFIAVVVGLGAMLGALLEFSGGVGAVAHSLVHRLPASYVLWALGIAGLLIGIPVFFDVAFIILMPLIHQLCARTGKSPMYFATPLLAGLLVGHAFIPPTPGPLAVAELLDADLGSVIVFGLLCGTPAMIVAGPLLARRFSSIARDRNVSLTVVDAGSAVGAGSARPTMTLAQASGAIVLPLFLIVGNTVGQQLLPAGLLRSVLEFVGHPFMALLISCLYVFIVFGVRKGVPARQLQDVMTRSLEPAGMVVLVTGAGGVFKEILVDSGVGDLLGELFAQQSIPPMLLAFLLAALIRVAQGSATVAMITSAGLLAPILQHLQLDQMHTSLVVIAIAAGASIASHVNDSGFWLVGRCLNLTEAETLRTWTVLSTVASVTGFVAAATIAALL